MTTRELPAAVLERYSARQSVCFCGVLPEIGRAWATVDNALFLWRYDVPDDVPVEYTGEDGQHGRPGAWDRMQSDNHTQALLAPKVQRELQTHPGDIRLVVCVCVCVCHQFSF